MKVLLKKSHWTFCFPSEGHVMSIKERTVSFKSVFITLLCVYEKTRGGGGDEFASEKHMTFIGKFKHTTQEASNSIALLYYYSIIAFWETSISYEHVTFL